MAALWLLVAALVLEVGERARAYYAEVSYAGFFNEQNSKVYRMVPAEELSAPENQFTLNEAPPLAPPAAPRANPGCPPAETLEAARDAYAAQGQPQRAAIAALRGELHIELDADHKLVNAWGDPLLLRRYRDRSRDGNVGAMNPELGRLLPALAEGASVGPLAYAIDEGFQSLPLTGEAVRNAEGAYSVVIRNGEPKVLPGSEIMAPEHSYEILNFRYKRDWCPENALACYNNFGFRDADVVLPKPEGVYRVVCIGGSTTEEGNSDAATYPNIMEQKLQAALGKDRIEVINAGICGIDSYFELRRIEDYLELQPDLIVYYNGINDFAHEHFAPWMAMTEPDTEWIRRSKFLTRWFNRDLLPPDDVIRAFTRETTMTNLRAMAYRARECGAEFAVCSFATPGQEHLSYRDWNFLDLNVREVWQGRYITFDTFTKVAALHNEAVRELCEVEGLHYIPAAEHFDAGLDHFFDTCHMTPLGLELKSNIISAYVEQIARERMAAQ